MPYKQITDEKIPLHVKREVIALCADYHRREVEIERGARRREVIEKYKDINQRIKEGIDEACPWDSDEIKRELLRSLGEIRGYNWSPLCTVMSAAAFYRRKALALYAIARRLEMI